MKNLLKSKKLISLSMLVVIVIAIPSSVYGYNSYNFNKLYSQGVASLNQDNFDEAINAFNSSLKYKPKQKELVEIKLSLANDLKNSKALFDSAVELQNGKKYLDAIAAFKKVNNEDSKRYNDAQSKIKECSNSYIKENLDNAKNESSNKNYDKAIAYLDTILKFDTTNKEAQSLKDEYNKDINQQAEAKSAEENKPASQSTVKTASTTTSTTNEVKSNSNLMITLTGGADPSRGRIMGIQFANVDPQPFGISFNVVQGGFGYEINYDITFYLVGRTVSYSGITSSQMIELPVTRAEVPRGENINIVINFKVNGKTYTTTGSRVLNDRY